MIPYDPRIIHEYAARLYDRARALIVLYGVMGAFCGLVVAVGVSPMTDNIEIFGLLLLMLFAGLGALIGYARGFLLRLQAQTALCQVQIELNTRPQATPGVGGNWGT